MSVWKNTPTNKYYILNQFYFKIKFIQKLILFVIELTWLMICWFMVSIKLHFFILYTYTLGVERFNFFTVRFVSRFWYDSVCLGKNYTVK